MRLFLNWWRLYLTVSELFGFLRLIRQVCTTSSSSAYRVVSCRLFCRLVRRFVRSLVRRLVRRLYSRGGRREAEAGARLGNAAAVRAIGQT